MKKLLLLLCCCCSILQLRAQVYHQVIEYYAPNGYYDSDYNYGLSNRLYNNSIAGIEVTTDLPSVTAYQWPCLHDYYITDYAMSFTIKFSPPIFAFRSNIVADTACTMTVSINGHAYAVTADNLSNTGCDPGYGYSGFTDSSGLLIFNQVENVEQLNIKPGYPIDSLTFTPSSGLVIMDLAIVLNCAYGSVSAAHDTIDCPGSDLHLYAGNHGLSDSPSFHWTGPNGFTSTLQNPVIPNASSSASGIYTVVATSDTCTFTASTVVSFNAPDHPVITANTTLCAGDTLLLSITNVQPGVSYSWMGPANFNASSPDTFIAAMPLQDSGYYKVVATLKGCYNSDSVRIYTKPLPAQPLLTSNSSVCAGDTLHIGATDATVGVTYSWAGPNGYIASTQNVIISAAQSANSGNYVVTIGLNGCTIHDTVGGQINVRPSLQNIGSNSPLCAGDTLLLHANSDQTVDGYQWSGPAGYSSSAQNPLLAGVTATGSYVVHSFLGNCISQADTVNVIVSHPPANPAINTNSPLCSGDTLRISVANGSTGITYQWAGPAAFSSTMQNILLPQVTVAESGNYILSLRLNGCSLHDTVSVTVLQLPAKPVITSNAPLCQGGNLSITAVSSTAAGYIWSGPAGLTSSQQTVQINNAPLSGAGIYIVTATLNGCVAADTQVITIKPLPLAVTASSNGPRCIGDTLVLSSNSSSPGVSYTWSGPAAYSANTQNALVFNIGTLNSGNYYLTATLNGCSLKDTVQVTIKPSPALPVANSNSPICAGATLALTAIDATTGISYAWSGPNSYTSISQNPAINYASQVASGNYIVRATLNGCSSADTIIVTVRPVPAIPLLGSNSPLCAGNTLSLNATDLTTGVSYAWTGPGGFISSQQNPVINNAMLTGTGYYTVIATLNSCAAKDSIQVTVLDNIPPVTIDIQSDKGDTICQGTQVTFIATVANAGAHPSYYWQKNNVLLQGINGDTWTTSTLADGDKISCSIKSNQPCQAEDSATSGSIKMIIQSVLPPDVHIEVYPPAYHPGDTETFTAYVNTASAYLDFQWMKNGQPIPGAATSTYSSDGLLAGDLVGVLVRSLIPCTEPDTVISNFITLDVKSAAVFNNGFIVYPNPIDNGVFTLVIPSIDEKQVVARIFNMLGQVVYQATYPTGSRQLITPDLAPGIYILEATSDNAVMAVRRLVIER